MKKTTLSSLLLITAMILSQPLYAAEQPLSVSIQRLSLESALKIAQAAITACRAKGIQIAAVVVDRSGDPQIILRDTLAVTLTLEASRQKAYTAVSFNAATSSLSDNFKHPFSVAKVDDLIMSAGGLPISAGGKLYGAIGVSGAPSGTTDEECAQAGIDSIIDDLEMAD